MGDTINNRPEAEQYHKKITDWVIASHLKSCGQFLYAGSARLQSVLPQKEFPAHVQDSSEAALGASGFSRRRFSDGL